MYRIYLSYARMAQLYYIWSIIYVHSKTSLTIDIWVPNDRTCNTTVMIFSLPNLTISLNRPFKVYHMVDWLIKVLLYIYSKTSLIDHFHRSTTPLYRSLYLGPNRSIVGIIYLLKPTASLSGLPKIGPMVGRFREVLLYVMSVRDRRDGQFGKSTGWLTTWEVVGSNACRVKLLAYTVDSGRYLIWHSALLIR